MRPDRVHQLRALATRKSRVLWSRSAAWRSADFTGTKRIVGRVTASQMASAGRVRLSALHVRLDVGGRHDPNLVAECGQFPGPEMRPGAGFEADEARLEPREEGQNLRTPKLALHNGLAGPVHPVNLSTVLARSTPMVVGCSMDGSSRQGLYDVPPYWHIAMPKAGAIHPISGATRLAAQDPPRFGRTNAGHPGHRNHRKPDRRCADAARVVGPDSSGRGDRIGYRGRRPQGSAGSWLKRSTGGC